MPTFEETKHGYANMWAKATLQPKREAAVLDIAKKYFANKARYQSVSLVNGVPPWWIFCVHQRESSGNFAGVLHNGEHIIGTGRKTKLEPANRGPFSTWQEAAVDALKIKGLDNIRDWNISRVLYEFERYNGQGYFYQKINSSYVWADTTMEQLGKYVRDHMFDPKFDDPQVGCAALLKALCKLDPEINRQVNGGIPTPTPQPVPLPPTKPVARPWWAFWRAK